MDFTVIAEPLGLGHELKLCGRCDAARFLELNITAMVCFGRNAAKPIAYSVLNPGQLLESPAYLALCDLPFGISAAHYRTVRDVKSKGAWKSVVFAAGSPQLNERRLDAKLLVVAFLARLRRRQLSPEVVLEEG